MELKHKMKERYFLETCILMNQLASPIKIVSVAVYGTERKQRFLSVPFRASDPGHILQSLDSEISRSIRSLSNSTGL